MIQGLAIACSICKFTFPYDYTRKYSQLLAQRKQRETPFPSLPLSTHNTHIESPHTGAFLECVASLLSCPAEWGRRDWEQEASSSGNGKAAKAGKRGSRVEQGREGGTSGSPGSNWCRKVYFPSALWLRLGHCEMFALFSLLARGRVEHKARRECWLGLAPARYLHFAEPKDIGMWCRQDVPANDT